MNWHLSTSINFKKKHQNLTIDNNITFVYLKKNTKVQYDNNIVIINTIRRKKTSDDDNNNNNKVLFYE